MYYHASAVLTAGYTVNGITAVLLYVSLLQNYLSLKNNFYCCILEWNSAPHHHKEPVALSIHLTCHCGSLSKQSQCSMSNINIWSQSSSCLSKYSQGEGKVAPSQVSCCVYYFSMWPLTCRQRKDFCLWKQHIFVWIAVKRARGRETVGKKGAELKVTGLHSYQILCDVYVYVCISFQTEDCRRSNFVSLL